VVGIAVARGHRRQAERERAPRDYKEIFEAVEDGIVLHDPETREIGEINGRGADILGYTVEELEGTPIGAISADDPDFSQEQAMAEMQRVQEGERRQFDWLVERKDGTTVWVEVSLRQSTIGGEDRLIAIIRDTTERNEHRREVEEQRGKIEALHEVATTLVSCRTETEVYELTVDAAERILDLYLCYVGVVEGESIVPKARSSRAGPEHARTMATDEGLAGKTFQTGTAYLIENVSQVDDAEPVQEDYRSAISVPIGDIGVFQAVSTVENRFDEADLELVETLVAHVVATSERIKHEKSLERQQQELQRQNERLEEFASVLSHDLRNPLGVAEGYLELLPEEGNEDRFEKIRNAHDRMEWIIEDVLTLARQGKEVGDTSTVALASVAKRAWCNVETGDAELSIGD
jgi:PAS domain S-box-containing protein